MSLVLSYLYGSYIPGPQLSLVLSYLYGSYIPSL
jgi:hypothetical protein